MNRRVLLIGLPLVAVMVIVLAVAFRYDPHYIESPLIGKAAPEFELQALDGSTYRLSELQGTPVVINFWATYCVPCYEELPILMAASQKYAGRAHFLGVIYQDEPALIQRFERELGSWGPSLYDPDGEVALAYGVYGPPETFILDGSGKIVDKVIGAISREYLEDVLEELL